MERLLFTCITVVLFSGIVPGTLLAEDEVPVVEITGEETIDDAADVAEEVAGEVEVEVESKPQAAEEAAQGSSNDAEVNSYAPQGDWDLNVQQDSDVRIRKIYEFLNDPEVTKTGKDRSLEYEFKYFNHGAITKAQRYNREGQYYIVTWTNKGAPADYELRIDYRQAKTRDKINTVTIPYPNAKGTFKGTFSITGDNYYLNGSILSWRISVVRNGVIVAQNKSFVW